MTKYQQEYRKESTRLKEWDYPNPWWYYVTINTKNHFEYLGKVENGEMILNEFGKIAKEEWLKTKEIRTNVDLDYFVIMPNHIHGILVINERICRDDPPGRLKEKTDDRKNKFETMHRIVSTKTLKADSLGAIIGQFKSICTKRIRSEVQTNFAWQSRFYDRIIRNEKELYNIRRYISNNPLRWEIETESGENICDL